MTAATRLLSSAQPEPARERPHRSSPRGHERPTGGGREPSCAEDLAELAQALLERLVAHPDRRKELLGEAFLACDELRRERAPEFARAARHGRLQDWCLPQVREALRLRSPEVEEASRPKGGWVGTFLAADGSDCAAAEEYAGQDGDALRLSQQALARAFSLAREQGNDTLVRNLGWYRERLSHKSYEAIATQEDRVPATVRTGVARARKFVLKIVHELQHAQPAPLTADAPPEIEPLRQLWLDQELDALERELERTRDEFGNDPHWLNLHALLRADRGHRAEARALYQQALVEADAAPIRARVLNNLANLVDDEGASAEAQIYWMRAHQLAPHAAAPLLNLLAAASLREDYPSAQHFAALLGELLSSGRMSDQERNYACRRLRENPKLGWLRDTEVWRLGPARWIRAHETRPVGSARRAVARAAVAVVSLCLAVLPLGARAGEQGVGEAFLDRSEAQAEGATGGGALERLLRPARRGGDSMGTPVGRGGGSKGD